ncbi:MAG TPA: rod shape-determining protein RodA [Chitinophagaceae bacterium]|jgi:rod shape determining protein RodA|nr:rod shape-determining protein RodA [Chitinophagaceae bacterium]
MKDRNTTLTKGLDWPLIYLYILLVLIGLLSIYAVEHRENENFVYALTHFSRNFSQQLKWAGISGVLALIILLIDSKFFTATANLFYVFGILLLLVVLVVGRDIKGSHSWLVVGGFQFQPAEFTKLCTLLALSKYLSNVDVDFTRFRSRLIASAIILLPLAVILLQDETGLALVYFSFFLVLYREGLPGILLVIGFSLIVLVLSALLVDKVLLFIIFTAITALVIYFMRKQIARKRSALAVILLVWGFCALFVMVVVPFTFTHVLKPYQVSRINVMLGKEVSRGADYNVMQSKIAIGSGGWLGKGYLKGTQTRFDFVPEQSTDFIFCTIGEDFGFAGSLVLILIYVLLLIRIIQVAERQRSSFSRIYAYGVACVLFFHVAINIGMTVGLAPVIGIPLPMISYGGSSLITFTMLFFIMVRLDADRQMLLR